MFYKYRIEKAKDGQIIRDFAFDIHIASHKWSEAKRELIFKNADVISLNFCESEYQEIVLEKLRLEDL